MSGMGSGLSDGDVFTAPKAGTYAVGGGGEPKKVNEEYVPGCDSPSCELCRLEAENHRLRQATESLGGLGDALIKFEAYREALEYIASFDTNPELYDADPQTILYALQAKARGAL